MEQGSRESMRDLGSALLPLSPCISRSNPAMTRCIYYLPSVRDLISSTIPVMEEGSEHTQVVKQSISV